MSIRPDLVRRRRRQRGISLIELIMFIIIVGVAVTGILSVMTTTTKASVDPMRRKQAIAIAESLLEEIQNQPFTYCDPDDPAAATATSIAGCATVEGIGVEGAETRYSATTRFDNVSDYHNFSMAGISTIDNTALGLLAGYTATVTVTQQGFAASGGGAAVAATESLRIDVNVVSGGDVDVTLTGYRLRYAPNFAS
jgi:MSHA pilin protein MshD